MARATFCQRSWILLQSRFDFCRLICMMSGPFVAFCTERTQPYCTDDQGMEHLMGSARTSSGVSMSASFSCSMIQLMACSIDDVPVVCSARVARFALNPMAVSSLSSPASTCSYRHRIRMPPLSGIDGSPSPRGGSEEPAGQLAHSLQAARWAR
jgi:hypothetical protein